MAPNNPSAKKRWELTQESFNQLLGWLNSNPDQAGKKYEEIRLRLIKIFTCRGCLVPEDLADETFNRVAKRVPEIAATYVGDPALYFFGVANNVHLESLRRKPDPVPPQPLDTSQESDLEYQCLEQCMQQLSSKSRELIMQYYRDEKRAKIDHRKELAQKLGIALNALRIQVFRIRASLQQCVFQCVQAGAVV